MHSKVARLKITKQAIATVAKEQHRREQEVGKLKLKLKTEQASEAPDKLAHAVETLKSSMESKPSPTQQRAAAKSADPSSTPSPPPTPTLPDQATEPPDNEPEVIVVVDAPVPAQLQSEPPEPCRNPFDFDDTNGPKPTDPNYNEADLKRKCYDIWHNGLSMSALIDDNPSLYVKYAQRLNHLIQCRDAKTLVESEDGVKEPAAAKGVKRKRPDASPKQPAANGKLKSKDAPETQNRPKKRRTSS